MHISSLYLLYRYIHTYVPNENAWTFTQTQSTSHRETGETNNTYSHKKSHPTYASIYTLTNIVIAASLRKTKKPSPNIIRLAMAGWLQGAKSAPREFRRAVYIIAYIYEKKNECGGGLGGGGGGDGGGGEIDE